MKAFYTHILLLLCTVSSAFSQTSWTGTASTDWNVSSNWTAGVPTSNIDAIIGDANFTGAFQPALSGTAANCKTLTIGTGSTPSALSITKNLNVSGNITIGSNGTILNSTLNYIITLKGNWSNSGTYTASASTASVTFSGAAQSITGATTFNGLVINSGSTVTLATNIVVNGSLTISGAFDATTSFSVTGTGALTVNSNGILLVKAATFAGNYAVSGIITLNGTSTVNYASATINQTISNSFTYGYLRVSGGMIKTLSGNLPALNSSSNSAGRIYVDAGTLDLSFFTANRGTTVPGGSLTLAENSFLKIAGTNSFPANFNSVTLASTSTVNYCGTNQTVPKYNYGNLTFESSSGAAIKTMPTVIMTIAGDFSSGVGSGTSVSFTAGNKITVNKNVNLGAGVTFNASSYTHTFKANWANNGIYNGGTSTAVFKGTNAMLSGTGSNNFYDLKFSAAGITAGSSTSISVSGNISTTGSGIFTHSAGGTTTLTGASKTVSGSGLKFFNVIVTGSYSTSASFSITGNFTINGTFIASNNSTVTLNGISKTLDGTGAVTFYGLNIIGSIT
ncbi:MAG: beta strand repeat-containing protein, partial [Flavobacteriales bacterium]